MGGLLPSPIKGASMAEDTTRVMVTVTESQRLRLDAVCNETGVSRSAVLALALADWLSDWERRNSQTIERQTVDVG